MLNQHSIHVSTGDLLSIFQIYQPLNIPERFSITISKAVDNLIQQRIPDLEALILFGSVSKAKIRTGSDIDICVLTSEPLQDRVLKARICESVEDLPCEVDVSFVSVSRLDSADVFTRELREFGKILWRRPYE